MSKVSTPVKVLAVAAVGVGVYFIATSAKAEPKKVKKKVVADQPKPPPGIGKPGAPKKPAGFPPPFGKSCYPAKFGGSSAYDDEYWDAGTQAEERQRIFDTFTILGYATPGDRDTMNAVGPDEALGGGDDIPNGEVKRFQADYNDVSRWKNFIADMRGLDEDGFVGPCTLNGLKLVIDALGEESWPEVVAAAKA